MYVIYDGINDINVVKLNAISNKVLIFFQCLSQ